MARWRVKGYNTTVAAEEREAWQQLWADVAAQIAVDPLEQGRIRTGRGQWKGAADGYARYMSRDSTGVGLRDG
jgi:hypothetical protein